MTLKNCKDDILIFHIQISTWFYSSWASFTDRFSVASTLIGFTAYWVGTYGVNQPCVQRYCAMNTETRGKL